MADTIEPMQFSRKRFANELYYYSNQMVLFFVMIISLTSGSWKNALVTSLIVLTFMLIQTGLLSLQGHIPILRLLYSLITPAAYSILRHALGHRIYRDSEYTPVGLFNLYRCLPDADAGIPQAILEAVL